MWNLSGANAGNITGVVSSFVNIQNLTGGTANDIFAFQPGGSVSGNIDGGGATNTLDYSGLPGPITLDVLANTAPNIGGTFANITNFVGSAGSDTLIGPAGPTTWSITGANAESVAGETFSSFENLTGGVGNDTFAFQPGGSVSGNIDGGGGTNTLDYSALAGPVTVNLQSDTATDIGGTFANIANFVGQRGSDTLIGPDVTTHWVINSANGGSVNGDTFSSFENLTGGVANDTFSFYTGGSVSGNIDGGGGLNTLDYSHYAGGVIVNLALNAATGVGGKTFNINGIIGGMGDDMFIGNGRTTFSKGEPAAASSSEAVATTR